MSDTMLHSADNCAFTRECQHDGSKGHSTDPHIPLSYLSLNEQVSCKLINGVHRWHLELLLHSLCICTHNTRNTQRCKWHVCTALPLPPPHITSSLYTVPNPIRGVRTYEYCHCGLMNSESWNVSVMSGSSSSSSSPATVLAPALEGASELLEVRKEEA